MGQADFGLPFPESKPGTPVQPHPSSSPGKRTGSLDWTWGDSLFTLLDPGFSPVSSPRVNPTHFVGFYVFTYFLRSFVAGEGQRERGHALSHSHDDPMMSLPCVAVSVLVSVALVLCLFWFLRRSSFGTGTQDHERVHRVADMQVG